MNKPCDNLFSRRQVILRGGTVITGALIASVVAPITQGAHLSSVSSATYSREGVNSTKEPVLTFYMGCPELDPTGLAEPYQPAKLKPVHTESEMQWWQY